jgi:hypothetical protein
MLLGGRGGLGRAATVACWAKLSEQSGVDGRPGKVWCAERGRWVLRRGWAVG